MMRKTVLHKQCISCCELGIIPSMTTSSTTAIAHPNIAFIKYWGNRDEALRLPSNGSISMNLAGLETRTTVRVDAVLVYRPIDPQRAGT